MEIMAVGAQASLHGNRKQKHAPGSLRRPSAVKPLPPAVLTLLQQGLAQHQAGQFDHAMALYQQVLKERPTQPDALHLSGVIHHQRGESERAVTLIRKALRNDPSNAHALVNLGAALTALERWAEAAEILQEAVARMPDSAEAFGNLAAVYENEGRPKDAAAAYRRAVELNPTNSKYLRHWAETAHAAELWDEAATAFARYLDLVPGDSAARNDMGLALQQAKRPLEALDALQRSLAEQPDNPMIHANLGNVLGGIGRLGEAEFHFRRALELAPDDWRMQINLLNLLWELGKIPEALALTDRLVAERSDDALLLNQLATRLTGARHYDRAEELLMRALEIDPALGEAYNGLGNIEAQRFNYAAAVEKYLKATELKPGYILPHLNLCMTLLKLHRFDEAAVRTYGLRMQADYGKHEIATLSRILQILKIVADFDGIEMLGDFWPTIDVSSMEHLAPALLTLLSVAEEDQQLRRMVAAVKRVGSDLQAKAAWKTVAPAIVRAQETIKVGLVSADFRTHSASRCIMPLLRDFDRNRIDLRCYSAVSAHDDPVQTQIRGLASDFVEIDSLDDPSASDRIRADGIDVLFDLMGWTAFSRVPLFAYKPAPHQVSWLGWPFSSGLPTIGHFLVDRFNAPTDPELMIEKPLVMDGAWACFEPLTDTPIGEPPFLRNGHITFGTLNNTYKVTQKQIALWARIMAAVPRSRFLMARAEVRSLVFCRNMLNEFAKYGIGEDRLELIGQSPTGGAHFDFYNQFDISLDTYPVVGGVTTMDSLWMGVPVVAMYGQAFHQRIGHSILNHCGLGEFSMPTPEGFVETACRLAADTERLAELRTELRPQVQASPLFDAPGFARRFGDAVAGLVGAAR
jgi:predicted O-linked N-acetylglucosamine transferase (SPINDLY family)